MGGGGKGSKQPKAPNYSALAAQQGEINQQTAQQLTAANRPNQYDAFGNSITWDQTPSAKYVSLQQQLQALLQAGAQDVTKPGYSQRAATAARAQQLELEKQIKAEEGNAVWNQHQNLSPEAQAAWEKYNSDASAASSKYGDLLNQYLSQYSQGTPYGNFAGGPQSGAFSSTAGNVKAYNEAEFNGDKVADALYKSVMDRALPQQQRDQAAIDSQLKLQGLVPGTEAYDVAMKNLMTSQTDSNNLASQNAVLAGAEEGRAKYASYLSGQGQQFGQDLSGYSANLAGNAQNYNQALNTYGTNAQTYQMNRNQPLQELAGIAGIAGGSPYSPTYTGFSSATGYNPTDLLGAAQAQQAASQASANSSNSKKGSTLGAASSLGGAFLGSK